MSNCSGDYYVPQVTITHETQHFTADSPRIECNLSELLGPQAIPALTAAAETHPHWEVSQQEHQTQLRTSNAKLEMDLQLELTDVGVTALLTYTVSGSAQRTIREWDTGRREVSGLSDQEAANRAVDEARPAAILTFNDLLCHGIMSQTSRKMDEALRERHKHSTAAKDYAVWELEEYQTDDQHCDPRLHRSVLIGPTEAMEKIEPEVTGAAPWQVLQQQQRLEQSQQERLRQPRTRRVVQRRLRNAPRSIRVGAGN